MPIISTILSALKECSRSKDLDRGRQLHVEALDNGLLTDTYVFNSLINMYSKCGEMKSALDVFTACSKSGDIVTWTCMIQGYADNAQPETALQLFDQLVKTSSCVPNARTFVAVLSACGALASDSGATQWLEKAKRIHARAASLRCCNIFVETVLVDMYGRFGCMASAERVFQNMSHRNVVTWTALLQGHVENGDSKIALHLFEEMERECVPNVRTYVLVLAACSALAAEQGDSNLLEKGKAIHHKAEMNDCWSSIYVESMLVDFYGKCRRMVNARLVFESMTNVNVVTWTSLLNGYVENGENGEAVRLFFEMERGGCAANARTYVVALTACASLAEELKEGEKASVLETGVFLHSKVASGSCFDIFVQTALINMYSECGNPVKARCVFDSMAEVNVVSWSSMLQGYVKTKDHDSALQLFSEMQNNDVEPNSATYIAGLAACGSSLERVSDLHQKIFSSGLDRDVLVANCLIDAYGRCGNMTSAQEVFNKASGRNVVSWNSLMNGYAQNGDTEKVFKLFKMMREQGVSPDKFTFTHLLSACSHAGLTDQGKEYFYAMKSEYGVNPDILHYTCLVDLLGRANYLDQAVETLRTMPVPPDTSIWSTLLGACRKWNNREIGELAFNSLVKANGRDRLAYSLLANIYSSGEKT